MNPELFSGLMIILILVVWFGGYLRSRQARPASPAITDELVDELETIISAPTAIANVWPDEDMRTVEVETATGWSIVFVCRAGGITGIESMSLPSGRRIGKLAIPQGINRAALASAVWARMAELEAMPWP